MNLASILAAVAILLVHVAIFSGAASGGSYGRFLIHLDQLRERCRSSADSLDRARRDFLDRHPLRWIPLASDRASERRIAPFYQGILTLLSAVVREDRMLLDGEDRADVRPRSS